MDAAKRSHAYPSKTHGRLFLYSTSLQCCIEIQRHEKVGGIPRADYPFSNVCFSAAATIMLEVLCTGGHDGFNKVAIDPSIVQNGGPGIKSVIACCRCRCTERASPARIDFLCGLLPCHMPHITLPIECRSIGLRTSSSASVTPGVRSLRSSSFFVVNLIIGRQFTPTVWT
jgi:hypothetical protein